MDKRDQNQSKDKFQMPTWPTVLVQVPVTSEGLLGGEDHEALRDAFALWFGAVHSYPSQGPVAVNGRCVPRHWQFTVEGHLISGKTS